MRVRRIGFTTVATALLVAVFVAVIGAAQAAPSGKSYTANVHLTNAATSSSAFTLMLKNDTKSRQTLGSANFTAPPSFVVPAASQTVTTGDGNSWTIASDGSAVVTFRPSTSGDALTPGESVSASVTVTVPSTCGSALWQVQAKQSNDFSGQPGNDFAVSPGSDLIPLGSFSIATIETVTLDGQHVPAILTGLAKASTTTAYDTCGNVKTTYSGATRSATLLTGATFSPTTGLNWSSGVGTVTITPAVTETDNSLTVTDPATGVTDTSNSFDTTDRLCTPADLLPCEWASGKIKVKADPPPDDASLGIGFNSSLSFSCAGTSTPAGGAVVNINPRYDDTDVEAIAVTLTYAKSATPGPATNYDVCFRKDDATAWSALEECSSTSPAPADAPCFISRKRVTGGDLEVVLWVETDDPWTGLG